MWKRPMDTTLTKGHDFYIPSDFTTVELEKGNVLAVEVITNGKQICRQCGLGPEYPCSRSYIGFHDMYEAIKDQQRKRGVYFEGLSHERKLSYASECAHALFVEVAELSSSWPFASWKTTEIDLDNINREIVDCIFFLVNIACCFGITPRDLQAKFLWVLKNNAQRIASGEHKEVSNGL